MNIIIGPFYLYIFLILKAQHYKLYVYKVLSMSTKHFCLSFGTAMLMMEDAKHVQDIRSIVIDFGII